MTNGRRRRRAPLFIGNNALQRMVRNDCAGNYERKPLETGNPFSTYTRSSSNIIIRAVVRFSFRTDFGRFRLKKKYIIKRRNTPVVRLTHRLAKRVRIDNVDDVHNIIYSPRLPSSRAIRRLTVSEITGP